MTMKTACTLIEITGAIGAAIGVGIITWGISRLKRDESASKEMVVDAIAEAFASSSDKDGDNI